MQTKVVQGVKTTVDIQLYREVTFGQFRRHCFGQMGPDKEGVLKLKGVSYGKSILTTIKYPRSVLEEETTLRLTQS